MVPACEIGPQRLLPGRFARERIAPLASRIDAEDWFPRDELWTAMGELGLHGITVEEEQGGLGLGYLEHVVAVEEVSRASASIGLSYGATSFYDPMIAKLVVYGANREIARKAMLHALDQSYVSPLRTNSGFMFACLEQPDWTCPGKVESSLEMKGELDDEAEAFYEGV
ncbi:acyl-CoA dehydrogenase family protein [Sphingomonas sp. CROZ-RG-20F-R02-07]|uniref:acyl-CoA dehydrogenase family protein n=1 Tax=Sphingomonas sp. CROZ-RG-20F-R02-07 TaxID=2914832 RepID=UPI0032218D20